MKLPSDSSIVQSRFFVKDNLAKDSVITNFEIADSLFGSRIIASAGT